MGRKRARRRRLKRPKKHKWRPTRVKPVELEIPAATVSDVSDLADAKQHYVSLINLAAVCAEQALTDGLLVAITPPPHTAQQFAQNVKNRQLITIDPVEPVPAAPQLITYCGEFECALDEMLKHHDGPVSFLYLGTRVGYVLDRFADRLTVGTTLMMEDDVAGAVCEWCAERGKAMHAISKSSEPPGYAVLLAS